MTSTGRTAADLHDAAGEPAHPRLAQAAPPIDLDAAADAIRALLVTLGQHVDSEHLRDTPRRVAAAYAELLTP